MTTDSSPPDGPYFPKLALCICVAGLVAGIGFLLTREHGVDVSASNERDEDSPITAEEAARIRGVLNSENSDMPHASSGTGTVVKISKTRIVVKDDNQQTTWPLAADVQIWKDRQAIAASDVEPGDLVEVDLQQLGSRSDGWMNTAVKINVVSSGVPDTTDSSQLVMPTTTLEGSVVETQPGVIVIAHENGHKSTLPLKPTALVTAGLDTIPLTQLAAGDKVKVTTSKVGSRADGWISMVDEIVLQSND